MRGATGTAAASQSPDGAAIGEVLWALTSLSLSRSLSGIKKSKTQRQRRLRIPKIHKIWDLLRTSRTSARTWIFFGRNIRGDRLELWKLGYVHTAENIQLSLRYNTLSGTTSQLANCNWTVNVALQITGLESSNKLRLCENPGTCLMNYVCHKHWTSGRIARCASPAS